MHQSKANRLLRGPLPIIAVILILLPILACAVHRAREASEQQTCAENLKRLGVACEMYQADWDDVLVPYGAPFAWTPCGMWPILLDAYIRKIPGSIPYGDVPPEYRCPSRPDTKAWAYERDYGMNQKCGGWMAVNPTPSQIVVVPVAKVRYPSQTIRIADVEWGAVGGSWFAATPVEYIAGDPDCKRFPEWHSDKGNVLWIDGHVSAMTRDQYNMRDDGPYSGQIWLRFEGPKPALPAD